MCFDLTHLEFQIGNYLLQLGDTLSFFHISDPLPDTLVLQLPLHVGVLPQELLGLVLLLLYVPVLEIEVGLERVHQTGLSFELVQSELGLGLQVHHFQSQLLQLSKT